jgi:hypothetical protein
VNLRERIDRADAKLHIAQFIGGHEIGLVQHEHIGKCDLVFRFRRVLQALLHELRIDHGDDRIERGLAAHGFVHEEGLRHRRRIREARGLDQNAVELALALEQPVDDADEIAAHGAADAAVVHLEDFLVRADDEVVVDADLAELVHDHGVFLAVRLRENAVQERGLAGAEIAGQHRYRDFIGHEASFLG